MTPLLDRASNDILSSLRQTGMDGEQVSLLVSFWAENSKLDFYIYNNCETGNMYMLLLDFKQRNHDEHCKKVMVKLDKTVATRLTFCTFYLLSFFSPTNQITVKKRHVA